MFSASSVTKSGRPSALCKVETDTVESYVLCVADIKSFGGNRTEHPGFGIYFLLFGWSALAVFFAVSTFIIYMNVAESNIFDRCTGHAADNGRIPAVGVPHIDVADQNTLHGAYGCPSGLRMRAPRRRKIGALTIFLMVILLITMSSRWPPSTVSSASPRQCSKIQLVRTMLRKPPLLSVPNLMRPVRYPWSGPVVRRVASCRPVRFPCRSR